MYDDCFQNFPWDRIQLIQVINIKETKALKHDLCKASIANAICRMHTTNGTYCKNIEITALNQFSYLDLQTLANEEGLRLVNKFSSTPSPGSKQIETARRPGSKEIEIAAALVSKQTEIAAGPGATQTERATSPGAMQEVNTQSPGSKPDKTTQSPGTRLDNMAPTPSENKTETTGDKNLDESRAENRSFFSAGKSELASGSCRLCSSGTIWLLFSLHLLLGRVL
jgi:hypothetical protein